MARRDRSAYRTAAILPSRRPTPTAAQLVVISGPGVGTALTLGGRPVVVIGRLPECDLFIDSESVSRHHATIEAREGGYRVRDQGSTNGTLVNQVRVEVHDLNDGDLIKIGKAVLKFVASGNVEAAYLRDLVQMSAKDALTGLANRRSFDERLGAEVAKLVFSGSGLGLALFDIDHFKRINDTHGHPAGDAVLRRLAEVVTGLVPDGCLLARVGGEEFAILAPSADAGTMRDLAERVRRGVEGARFDFADRAIPVTVSVGTATARGVQRGEDLYASADGKLYEAKNAGRNCVR